MRGNAGRPLRKWIVSCFVCVGLGAGGVIGFRLGAIAVERRANHQAIAAGTASAQQFREHIFKRILSVNAHAPVKNHYNHFPEWLKEVEAQTGVDHRLLMAVAEVECEYEIACISDRGALGPFQLMPTTARDGAKALGIEYIPERIKWGMVRGVRAPLRIELGTAGDLQSALRIAAWYLRREMVEGKKGATEALMAYVMGATRLDAAKKEKGHSPVYWYAEKVLDRYYTLLALERGQGGVQR